MTNQSPPYDPQLEAILVTLARRYARNLVPQDWQKAGDLRTPLPRYARLLANSGILVIYGDRMAQWSEEIPTAVRECAEAYIAFYRLLAQSIFPHVHDLWAIEAQYFSISRSTLLIFFRAEMKQIIAVMAGYLVPYITERQRADLVLDVELVGIMERLLKRLLDGQKVNPTLIDQLKRDGAEAMRPLLDMTLRQIPLLQFDEPLGKKPRRPPMPPGSLPGDGADARQRTSPQQPVERTQAEQGGGTKTPDVPPTAGPETGPQPPIPTAPTQPPVEPAQQPSGKTPAPTKPPTKPEKPKGPAPNTSKQRRQKPNKNDPLLGDRKGGTAPLPIFFEDDDDGADDEDDQ